MIISSALAARLLADESLATLPLGIQFIATMLSTFAASMLMRRIGRRAGFTIGALSGVACGLLSAWAIYAGSFVTFCLSGLLFGVAMAFAQYYRFAAAEAAEPVFRSRRSEEHTSELQSLLRISFAVFCLKKKKTHKTKK